MSGWLLGDVPTLGLAVPLIAGLTLFAVAGCYLFRQSPLYSFVGDNDVAGVSVSIVAGVYGIILAFVIVVSWDDLQTAQRVVGAESNALAQLLKDTQVFEDPHDKAMKAAARGYAHAVVYEEWDAMRRGDESSRAEAQLERLYKTMRNYQPKEASQASFYSEASSNLDQLDSSRRERIRLSQRKLPGILSLLIIGGALLIVVLTFFFKVESQAVHICMSGGVAVLLSFMLLTYLLLQRPFSGAIAVDSRPFQDGALSQLWP